MSSLEKCPFSSSLPALVSCLLKTSPLSHESCGFFFKIQSIISLTCIVFNSFIFNTYIVAFINMRFCCLFFISRDSLSSFSFFFFFFWLCDMPYRILVPQPGIEPRPLAVTAQSPTTREFPVPPEFCPSSCCRDDDRHLSLLITVYFKIIQI